MRTESIGCIPSLSMRVLWCISCIKFLACLAAAIADAMNLRWSGDMRNRLVLPLAMLYNVTLRAPHIELTLPLMAAYTVFAISLVQRWLSRAFSWMSMLQIVKSLYLGTRSSHGCSNIAADFVFVPFVTSMKSTRTVSANSTVLLSRLKYAA